MVTIKKGNDGVIPWELYGKSTDTKPTAGVPNGSTFFVLDTSAVYIFDAEAQEWNEV